MALAENIKAKREEKGLNQSELAGRIHVCRDTISKIEAGNRIPSAEKLMLIAKELDTTADELWNGAQNKKTPKQ